VDLTVEIPDKRFKLLTVRGELAQPALDLDRTSELLLREDESEYRSPG
jgi:hypothetical protein